MTVTVTNTGPRAADAVVLAFFRAASSADGTGGQPLPRRRASDGVELLSPLKQLFDFQRHAGGSGSGSGGVRAGQSAVLTFNITAASLALVQDPSGDLVAVPGSYEIIFDDGSSSGSLVLGAMVTGAPRVVDPFPSTV